MNSCCQRALVLTALLWVFFPVQFAFAMNEEPLTIKTFVGTAYPLQGTKHPKRVLYTEHHQVYLNAEGEYVKSEVVYRDPEGDIFAIKKLRFTGLQSIPELRFDDFRTGGVLETANQIMAQPPHVALTRIVDNVIDNTKVELDAINRSVVDAGFDLFVIKQWDALLKGQQVKLDFLALTRGAFYEFYLQKVSSSEDLIVFRLKPSSLFLGLLVDPIYLSYDLAKRRLLSFEGLTNIETIEGNKSSGNNHLARIEYHYPE